MSNQEIENIMQTMGVKDCRIEREAESSQVRRRSTIDIDDQPRVMAEKYIRAKLSDEEEIVKMLEIHDNVVKL